MSHVNPGLEGVVVARQDICALGSDGQLLYRGYPIAALAAHAAYEEVVYLLWHGNLPTAGQLADLRATLASLRSLTPAQLALIQTAPATARPLDVCRTALSALEHTDAGPLAFDRAASLTKAASILAKLPTLIAAIGRHRRGLPPVPPRTDLSHAANFLWMLTGAEADPTASSALNLYLVLLAELEMNASTFACRVAASTWAGMHAAIVSGVAALSGHAHGGAVQEVMLQFQEIGSVENVAAWLEETQRQKRRIMGIGHRVFNVVDPRAPLLRAKVEELAPHAAERRWFDVAARLDELTGQQPFFQQRNLHPNVDYYAAPLLHMLGLEPPLFPCVFAISRVAGWSAHVMHQYENNRLITPVAEYSGPPRRAWVPLPERTAAG